MSSAPHQIVPLLPPGRAVRLPRRGTTFVRHLDGPPGAPTVLLLHGWTVTADLNWFQVYRPLSRHFSVVALDHRGHGRGIRSLRPFRLEDCADDAAGLARVLGLERVIPVGYSMGGTVAQLLWRRHPDLVAGLVLCATAASFSRGDARERLFFSGLLGLSVAARLTPGAVQRRAADAILGRRFTNSPIAEWGLSEVRRGDAAAILQAGAAIGSFRSTDWLGELDVPTAVVVTTEDQVIPPRRQLHLAERIPGATVHQVQGDHGACVTQARVFTPALVEACAGVAVQAGLLAPSH